MADSVNVGVLKALLEVGYDPSGVAKFLDQLTTAKARQISAKKETDQLISSFKNLAAKLDPVVKKQQEYDRAVKILDSSLKKGIATQAQYNALLAQAKNRLQDTTTWTQRLGAEIGGNLRSQFGALINPANIAMAGIGAGLAGLAALAKGIATASLEAEASTVKVASAVSRYGDRAGVTIEEINKLADAESKLLGIDDELIAETAALGLQYNRISGDILPELTVAALDMAAATGKDVPAAMEKVASYVNLPLQALTKLKREGYAVSESQSALVKDMLKANNVAGAQQVILGILQDQYKGAAADARDSLGGALGDLSVSWENFLEKLGEDNLGPMREGVEALITLLKSATDQVDNFSLGWHQARAAINAFTADALNGIADTIEMLSKAAPMLGLLGLAVRGLNSSSDASARARKGAAAAEKNYADSAKQVRDILLGIEPIQKKRTAGTLELTEAEDKLSDSLRKQQEEWKKLLEKAADAVDVSRDLLNDTNALLAARKISVDAMNLQKTVQEALNKAQAAGKAATSAQRLEIIRNTMATFQLGNAIEDIGEREQQTTDLFAENRKELEKQVTILDELLDILTEISDIALKGSIDVNVDQLRGGAEQATEFTRGRVNYAKEWRETWKSASDVANEEIERVMGSLLTVEEKERAIADVRIQLLNEQLEGIYTYASGWQQFFSTIGGMFGGFAQQVSNSLSQMISTAQAFQSAGNAIGGQAGSYISAAGPFFAVAGALVGAIQADNARIAQRQYTSSADLGFGTGQIDVMGRQGRALANALQSALDPILDVLASTLADLPNIKIMAREDGKGFKVQVYDTILGIFDTMEEAVDAAVIASINFLTRTQGLTATMRQILENTLAQTSEDLMRDLEFGQWYDNLGLGAAGQAIRDAFSEMRRGIDDALRLGLGADKIKEWFDQQRREIIGGLLGVDYSAAQALRNLQGAMQALSDLGDAERARVQEILASHERELNELIAGGPRRNEETGVLESQALWQREIDRLRGAIADYTQQLNDIPEALSEQELALGVWSVFEKYLEGNRKYHEEAIKFAKMRIDMEFRETQLALVQMGLWEQWAGVWQDAYNAAMAQAGKPRGGGGNSNREGVRSFIADRTFEQSLRTMSELDQAVAQVNREYEAQIAQAGKDEGLRRQLIALRDEEIRQLEREHSARTVESFQDFVGGENPFKDVRDNAAALIKDIESSVFGDARKANMISRVLGEIDRQVSELSNQEAVSLFGSLLSDLQKYGASEQQLTEIRNTSMFIEHQLNLDNYRKRIALLKVEGNLAPAIIESLERGLRTLEGVDLEEFFKNNPIDVSGSVDITDGNISSDLKDNVDDVNNELNRLAESFRRAKEDIQGLLSDISVGNLGIVSPLDAFNEAKRQYQETLLGAQSGNLDDFEAIDEIARQYIEALKSYSPDLAAVELPKIKTDLSSLLSLNTIRDDNLIYTEKFAENQKATNDTLLRGFTDLSNSNHVQTEIQGRMLDQLATLNTNQAELNARLARLESGGQGLKRAIGG